MSDNHLEGRAQRALGVIAPLAAWTVYLPLGAKYLALVIVTALSAAVIGGQPQGWHKLLRSASLVLPLAFASWLLLTALWSPADWTLIATHAWMYCLPLCTALIAAACPPKAARRALVHFVVASAVVGTLWLAHARGLLPASTLLDSTITAKGNQRIATSLLLALGVALAGWLAAQSAPSRLMRPLFVLGALLALAGLTSQDRRTGMLLLPLLLLAWALSAPLARSAKLALVGLVALTAVGVWFGSETVRARFAEGRQELQAYTDDGAVVTSWGQRARMVQITSEMVRERPLLGHGVGSWVVLWNQRTTPGTRLWDNTTPHNEYLLVATQGGAPALLLLMAWLGLMMGRAWRAGSAGTPALMAWLALAAIGVANAALRDAKFALPLLLLAGLASALQPRAGGPDR